MMQFDWRLWTRHEVSVPICQNQQAKMPPAHSHLLAMFGTCQHLGHSITNDLISARLNVRCNYTRIHQHLLSLENTSPAAPKRVLNRQQAASYVDDSLVQVTRKSLLVPGRCTSTRWRPGSGRGGTPATACRTRPRRAASPTRPREDNRTCCWHSPTWCWGLPSCSDDTAAHTRQRGRNLHDTIRLQRT